MPYSNSLRNSILSPLLSLGLGATAAFVMADPAFSTQFTDVTSDHWAYDYVEALAERQIINGYGDGRFYPTEPVTRSQFATIVRQAFLASEPVPEIALEGVPLNYWAYDALAIALTQDFLSDNLSFPIQTGEPLTRGAILAGLVNGLGYESDEADLTYYVDEEQIPDYLRPAIAAATQAQLVVSYPEVNWLHADRLATRAEVAGFVYQALVREGQATPLDSAPHVANSPEVAWSTTPVATIPVSAQQLRLSSGGNRLATLNTSGGMVQVWDGQTGAAVMEMMTDGSTRFHAIAISHDGTQAAAIVQIVPDNALSLTLWDVETGRELWQQSLGTAQGQFRDEAGFVSILRPTLVFQPGDNTILSQAYLGFGPDDRPDNLQIQLHDVATGNLMRSLEPDTTIEYRQFAFSPDGTWLAAFGFAHPEVAYEQRAANQIVDIWQVETGSRLRTLRPVAANDFSLVDMVFTADNTLRTLSQYFYETHLDTWNVQTGEPLAETTAVPFIDRQDGLIQLSPDGEHYFVRGDVAGTRLINIAQEIVTYLESYATRATFDATGGYLAIADQDTVKIFAQSNHTMP